MKIIHIADLHLGQILYQHYDRTDEHDCFFEQLETWCVEEKPDALLVCGDVFDIQQPSASTQKYFTDRFVRIHRQSPDMELVIVAGNHDSASRLQAGRSVWAMAHARLVGVPPAPSLADAPDGWQSEFVAELRSGYIVALPYMAGERPLLVQRILDWVAARNTSGKPVVMTGHLAVTGMDPSGHNLEIGRISTQDAASLGTGYDYLALGHIHKPQTIGHQDDCMRPEAVCPSGVIRYSGSVLHVSCDEKFPHTVSVVELSGRGGEVCIRQHRIEQLRHFYELPLDGGSFRSSEEALAALEQLATTCQRGYFRFRFDYRTVLPSNFNNLVYDRLGDWQQEVRYNPKHIWTGAPEVAAADNPKPVFEVAELQQMTDPMLFVEKTADQYPGLDLELVRRMFAEVRQELAVMENI